MASMVKHVHTGWMGYSIFSVGDRVRIKSGEFAGMAGVVSNPASPHDVVGTVNPRRQSMLLPVTVVVAAEGRKLALRVAPELLQRV